jgi:hypothetical protein
LIRTDAGTRSEALDLLGKRLAEMSEGRFDPDAAHTRVIDLYADLQRDYAINSKRVGDLACRWKHQARVVYLPPEALEALKAWDGKTMALERERGIIVRHVFDNDGRAIRHY